HQESPPVDGVAPIPPNEHVSIVQSSVSYQAGPEEPPSTDGVYPIQPNESISNVQLLQPPSSVSGDQAPQETSPVDLKNDSKIALGLFSVSTGSLVAVVVVNFGNRNKENAVIFRAFTLLCFISLISDSIILLLAIKCPNIPCLTKTVRLALCVSVVSLSAAYTLAVSILLAGNHV
ncbi:hypothetical protein MKX03_035966, partial [Papaver bracteatum]